ncbi:MAG: hypothetical protein JSR86_14570 [Proteobacteria bacterium]|nr:hypothetical protein [Pseudomonadota bacterium]
MSTAAKVRLQRAAQHFAAVCKWEWRDLYQEAVRRCLDTRQFPRDVDPVVFIVNVMRSIASAERTRRDKRPEIEFVDDLGAIEVVYATEAASNAEDLQLEAEESAARIKALEDLFADDEELQMVMMGMSDEMTASELRALGGWSEQQYATIKRRMRRRLNARFGAGWTA